MIYRSIFAVLSVYLIVCSVILSVKAFEGVFTDPNLPTALLKVQSLFNSTNGVLMAALASTFGVYFVSSVLFVGPFPNDPSRLNVNADLVSFRCLLQADPWHMFSSFPQYMLLAPSFTNVLNVYAFCNLHDVSVRPDPFAFLPFFSLSMSRLADGALRSSFNLVGNERIG
jgi:chitin synthase